MSCSEEEQLYVFKRYHFLLLTTDQQKQHQKLHRRSREGGGKTLNLVYGLVYDVDRDELTGSMNPFALETRHKLLEYIVLEHIRSLLKSLDEVA